MFSLGIPGKRERKRKGERAVRLWGVYLQGYDYGKGLKALILILSVLKFVFLSAFFPLNYLYFCFELFLVLFYYLTCKYYYVLGMYDSVGTTT
jgi:hypothetical protein